MLPRKQYFCLLLILLAAIGCGRGVAGPELAEVTGIVTLNGAPLAGKEVAFIPATGRPAGGLTDSTGRYSLKVLGGKDGAAIGPNSVQVSTPLAGPPAPNYVDPIPKKYNVDTTLTAEVKPGKNEFNFDLSTK